MKTRRVVICLNSERTEMSNKFDVSNPEKEKNNTVKGRTMDWKKQKSLSGKLAIYCALFGLLIALVGSTLFGITYRSSRISNYEAKLYCLDESVMDYIVPQKVREYLETGVKDDYYELVQGHMDNIRACCDLAYLYVLVPGEDEFTYVWDADYGEETKDLLDTEAYSHENDCEIMMGVMDGTRPENKMYMYHDEEYGYIGSVYMPIKDNKGRSLALIAADVELTHVLDGVMKFIYKIALIIFVLSAALSFFLYFLLKKKILVPIEKVSTAANTMMEHIGDEASIEIDVETNDEIEELANSFEAMDASIKKYMKDLAAMTAEKERIGAELSVATQIQSDMLPTDFIDTPEIAVYASMRPAKEVGGDFYDFFMVDENHLAIVMADVSGKGVPAALFMAISKTLIQDRTLMEDNLGSVFASANDILCIGNSAGMFVTAFEAVLDIRTGDFTFVNAGHEPPFAMRADGDFKMYRLKPSLVLAAMEGMPYQAGTAVLQPGDRIFQYPDGVTEATNWNNELFELDRLEESLNRHKNESPKQLLESVRNDIDEFVGLAPQFDDLTMICMDFKAKKVVVSKEAAAESEASETLTTGAEANAEASEKEEAESEIKNEVSQKAENGAEASSSDISDQEETTIEETKEEKSETKKFSVVTFEEIDA